MSISLYYHTHGIRKGYQLVSNEFQGEKVISAIELKRDKQQCAACRSFNVTPTFVKNRDIQSLLTGTKKHVFRVRMHRLNCRDCGKFRLEKIRFTPGSHCRYSSSLARSVLELRRHMSIKAVAEHYGLHWGTVKNIEKTHLGQKFKYINLKEVTAIGIDEVFMGRKFGDKENNGYLTIVRDLESGAVLFVGEGRSSAALTKFTKRLRRQKPKIRFVAIDLGQAYASWVRDKLPRAVIVYDHFHVIKLMNERINKIRRRIMAQMCEEEKKDLKGKRWHFVINRENLSDKAKKELEHCKFLYDDLATAHMLKESLRNIYRMAEDKTTAELAFERWYAMASESGVPELESMAKTIKQHYKGILAYWDSQGITSASMEGFNNKVGWLTRQAYGYRDKEYLILKIYDLPDTRIKKVL